MGLLDGQLKKAIADGFRGKLLKGTLRKETASAVDGHGDPIVTPTSYPAQGFVDAYSAVTRAMAGIPAEDSKLVLIAGLCGATPAIGDKVLFAGQWWQARNVAIDPAGATYECQSFQVQDPT